MSVSTANSSAISDPYENVKSTTLLGYWPFVGTYYDISPNALGPALYKMQGNTLSFDEPASKNFGFVKIRRPGYLNIPSVDLRTISFAIEFQLRLPSAPTDRQQLLCNWQKDNWQYWMFIESNLNMNFTLRRDTKPGESPRDLVNVWTKVPVGKFFRVTYVFDNTARRTLSVYIDDVLGGSAVVGDDVTDLTLHSAVQEFVQFGNKGDDVPTTGAVDADLCQLRIYELKY